jgi:hypothetical protein
MATTTTNFGWDIPQSTDLVKDGATAIAALGQDIDTAFVDFKGGTTGQVLKKTSGTDLDVEWGTPSSGLTLINTTSFSGVSSQSVNDVFSADYTNYMIQITAINDTTNNLLRMRFRVGGADETGTQYSYTGFQTATNNTSGMNGSSLGTTSFVIAEIYKRTGLCTIQLARPFATDYKTLTAHSFTNDSGSPNYQVVTGGMSLNTTSYTGFTIFPGASTISGVIKTYGYN